MVLYAEANTTTPMPDSVVEAWRGAANRGAPFAGEKATAATERLIGRFAKQMDRETGSPAGRFAYVHTSGAAEANTLVAEACVNQYWAKTGRRPHVLLGEAEPESLRRCAMKLERMGRCVYTYAAVDPAAGVPTPETLKGQIRFSTCLVSVSAVNANTGAVANLAALSAVCWAPLGGRRRRVPFHTDASLLFARSVFDPEAAGVDAYSVAAHLFHGPPGFGFLAVRAALAADYAMRDLVAGRLPNLPAVAAAAAAYEYTHAGRAEKNQALDQCTRGVVRALAARCEVFNWPAESPPALAPLAAAADPADPGSLAKRDAAHRPARPESLQLFVVGPPPHRRLPGTLLLSFRGREAVDAAALAAALDAAAVACRVYVGREDLAELGRCRLPAPLRECVVRVSFLDSVSKKEGKALVGALLEALEGAA